MAAGLVFLFCLSISARKLASAWTSSNSTGLRYSQGGPRLMGPIGDGAPVRERDAHEVGHVGLSQYEKVHSLLSSAKPDACGDNARVLHGRNEYEPDLRICMPALPCTVYSFGIDYNWLFDEMMLDHGCSVWSFDPSLKLPKHRRRPTHLLPDVSQKIS